MNARSLARSAMILAAPVLTAGLAAAQGNSNDAPCNGNGDVVFSYVDPSAGGPIGSPSVGGDLFWKVVAGDLLTDSVGSVPWIGLAEHFIGSTDWTTGSDFWDIGLTSAHAATGGGGGATGPLGVENLVPDFFTNGGFLSTIVSFGPSGFPNPCSISPTGCTNGSGGSTPATCPPPVTGYVTSATLASSIPIVGNGVDADALTHFAPGGMALFTSAGSCGVGDYDFSGRHSTDEHQADVMLVPGDAYLGGFQAGPSTSAASPTGARAELLTTISATATSFDNSAGMFGAPTVAAGLALARTAGAGIPGYGPDLGVSGVLLDKNGLNEPVPASYGVTVHAVDAVGLLCFPAAGPGFLTPPGPPGFTLGAIGATLLVSPTAFFSALFGAWASTGPIVGTDTDGDTLFDEGTANTTMPSLSTSGGTPSLTAQAFIVTGFGPLSAVHTTAQRTRTF